MSRYFSFRGVSSKYTFIPEESSKKIWNRLGFVFVWVVSLRTYGNLPLQFILHAQVVLYLKGFGLYSILYIVRVGID